MLRPAGAAEVAELAEALAVAHRVAVLAETDPAAPLVVATRAALEIADARRADRGALRRAALQVHGGDRVRWARWAEQWLPAAELAARRTAPTASVDQESTNRQRGQRRAGRRAEADRGVAYGGPQKDGE
jgi:hypothetical protein